LRNLLRALGSKNDARYNLKIVDIDKPEGERNERTPREDAPAEEPAEAPAEARDVVENTTEEAETAPETEEIVEAVEESTPEDVESESSLAEKTRKDLADLDDLDI
jgi:sugar-specific transcriptional regulator TrmB